MATLYFKIGADYDNVIRLRDEIKKLENQLKSFGKSTPEAQIRQTEERLASTRQEFMRLATEAAKAGAAMENGFKKKIYDASQTVNVLSEKIIAQRSVIKGVEFDVKRLGEAYRTALKNNPIGASGKLSEYNAARKVLDEEKNALFGLTQQQAEARLSVKKLRDEYSLYKKEAGDTVEINNGLSLSWGKMLGVIGGVTALKQLGSEIVRVRGEFQSMQTAIETMVGKDMANTLMPQIKEMAKISPLTLSDMVNAEKMMLGFNIQAEDTIRYLQALSDISMGNSVKFNSLTLAFSQMSAAGKLMGQDLNQMINAGFNPLQIIAEKTGKSIATLKDEMSKGAVSAKMVQQAFIDATSAGGKFYQMSENASKTINGQLSMMQDALDAAFNEMGQASEGVIMKGIQLTTSLIQNYETVGKVLVGLVSTYGIYRTAVMLATVATSKHTIAEIALTNARVLARKAQMLLNAAMLTNPYVAVATVLAGLVATMWAFHDSSTEAEKAQKKLNERQEEAKEKAEEHKQKIDALIDSSRDIALADVQRGQSLAELRKEYPKIFEQYDLESIKLADILKLKQQIAEEDARRDGERQKQELSDINKQITYYENLLKSLSGQKGVDGYVKKLKELRADRDAILLNNGKNISEQFISSLKDIDISEFDRYIAELERRIEGKGNESRIKLRLPIDVKGSLSDEALFEVKDIKTLIDTAKSTKQTRIEEEKNKTTYQQDLAAAKSDWKKAKKEYEALLKDQKATSKQVEEARLRLENADKAYKKLSGTSLNKQETEQEKEVAKGDKTFRRAELNYGKELEKSVDEAEEAATESVIAMQEQMQAERDSMNRYLQEYGTYQEKRLAIAQEYAEKIAEAGGEDTWQGKLLAKERDGIFADLDVEALKTTSAISGLFGDMTEKTLAELDRINKEGTAALEFLKGGKWDSEKGISFGITKEQFDTISKSPDKLQAISKALRDNKKYAEDLRLVYEKVADGLRGIFNAGNDKKKLKESLDDLQSGLNEIMQLGSFLSDSFSNLGDAFESDALSKVSDGINVAMDGLNSAMQGAQAGAMFGPIGAAAGAAIGLVSSLASSIAKIHDEKNEKRIQRLQDQIDTLDVSYEKLSRSIEDAYSKNASSLIEDQNKLLEQQKILIQQQIKEEEDKKKTDDDRIKEWKQQIEEINDTIEENKEKAVDAIFGNDIQSAIEDFTDAYTDAWSGVESRAGAARDSVKQMMRDMVTESIKDMIKSSGSMEQIRKKLQEFYADNVLTGWEQQYIYNMAENVQKQIDEQFAWADDLFKESQDESGSSRAFGTEMTQDQGAEISGRLTQVAESNYRIELANQQQTLAITELKGSISSISNTLDKSYNLGDEVRTILAQSYMELRGINENTAAIVRPIQMMQRDISEIKDNTKGL